MAERDPEKWWKKGTKVIRLYGTSTTKIKPGDVATLAKDQDCPGDLELVEFPGAFNHDPIRFRRVEDYPDFDPKELSELYYAVHYQEFEEVVRIIKRKLKGVRDEQSTTSRNNSKRNRSTKGQSRANLR